MKYAICLGTQATSQNNVGGANDKLVMAGNFATQAAAETVLGGFPGTLLNTTGGEMPLNTLFAVVPHEGTVKFGDTLQLQGETYAKPPV